MTRISEMIHKAALPTSAGRVPLIIDGDSTNYTYDLAADIANRHPTLFTNLSNITVGTATLISTSGYSVLDKGAAVYVYDATVNSAYVAANPRSSGITADGKGFRLSLEQDITPEMCGAVTDGITDDLIAIQAALNSGAPRTVLPSVVAPFTTTTYRITGTLTHPAQVEITGNSQWVAIIESSALALPILSAANCADGAIKNVHLKWSGTPLAGADAVVLNNCQTWTIRDLWVSSCWNGVHMIGGGNHFIDGYRCYNYENTALYNVGSNDVVLCNFRFHAGDSIKGRQGGIRLEGGTEAFICSDGDITLGKYSLTTADTGSTARGSAPYFNRFSSVFFDSANLQGAFIRSLFHTDFVSCWFASAGHDDAVGYGSAADFSGIDIATSGHLRFIGGDAYTNGGRGALVDATSKFVRFSGMGVKRNGFTRSSSTPGIEFAAGATDFAVAGCLFDKDADTTTYKMDVAVLVNTGASDRYFVDHNLLGGCTVTDSGTGVNKAVEKNF